ncbi:3-oxoacyl-[acyl-carrier-protein] synthase 3 [Pseudobythopirellula maris]|uniref:Beta-ketoacyl-[acyl-carrier-protein] synthase III n=1 Tax=Pseudobythopirellula maris TaxID=2527991 RepID=A0A5C5ZTN1_9BACT|nr:beta-ketoacyl-ACP synthase III [Pseudobythopirellula maris]TWT90882.1 3-oxoacyl-[acyl-carrier-protein] synthase 3 [Pseudobythopirellula maris]
MTTPAKPDIDVQIRRGPLHRLMGVRIAGTGNAVGSQVVSNDDLASLGCDADWIIQRTGIRERRHAAEGETTGSLATAAAERALEAAGGSRDEVDLLLLATFTPDRLCPQTATSVQDSLGLNCPAMDLTSACAGFVYALFTGAQFIATGAARRVLVVGADVNTRVINPNDKKVFPLFGDGAGAVVLERGSDEQGMMAYTFGADGSGADLLTRYVGGVEQPFSADLGCGDAAQWLLSMNGKPVFKWAVRLLEDTFAHVLEAAGRDTDAVKLWLLHQANARILTAAADSMGIPADLVVKNIDRLGNTSGGSIPIALDESVREGRIAEGDELMLCGFGAGLSWGTALWKW